MHHPLRHLRVRPDCHQTSPLVLPMLSWLIELDDCFSKPVSYEERQWQRKIVQGARAVSIAEILIRQACMSWNADGRALQIFNC